MLKKYVGHMQRQYGDVSNWPKIGCGSKFVPYKYGRSMVVEIQCEDGRWKAFSSARLPQPIDDEIKKKPRPGFEVTSLYKKRVWSTGFRFYKKYQDF